jgi:hypothetical protein
MKIPDIRDQHKATKPLFEYIQEHEEDEDIEKVLEIALRLNEIFVEDIWEQMKSTM